MSETLQAAPELSPSGRIWQLVDGLIPAKDVEITPFNRGSVFNRNSFQIISFGLGIRPVDDELLREYSEARFRLEKHVGRSVLGMAQKTEPHYEYLVIKLTKPISEFSGDDHPNKGYQVSRGRFIDYRPKNHVAEWNDFPRPGRGSTYYEPELIEILEALHDATQIPIFDPQRT